MGRSAAMNRDHTLEKQTSVNLGMRDVVNPKRSQQRKTRVGSGARERLSFHVWGQPTRCLPGSYSGSKLTLRLIDSTSGCNIVLNTARVSLHTEWVT